MVDNPILHDLHNASYPTQPHSVIVFLPPCRLSSKLWLISQYGFRIYRNRSRFYFAGNPQKVDNNHRAIYFAYSGISSIQFNSEIQPFRLRIAVNAIFFKFTIAQAALFSLIYHRSASFPIKYTIE